jgi:hypothetical protein
MSNEQRQAETAAQQSDAAEVTTSSPTCSNTHVVGIPKRNLKFRFWLGHTKKMTYDHSLIEISHAHWDFTEDIIPLQFTGLVDKNGIEI